MKFKLGINKKMLLFILGTSSLVYLIALGFISLHLKQISNKNNRQIVQALVTNYTNQAKRQLDLSFKASSTLAQLFSNYDRVPEKNRINFFNQMMEDLLKTNQQILSVWAIWEPSYMQHPDSSETYSVRFYRQNDEVKMTGNPTDEKFLTDCYLLPKNKGREIVIEPSYYNYFSKQPDQQFKTHFIIPIINQDNFMGVLGIDLSLSGLADTFQNIHPLGDGTIYLLSNNGTLVSNPESKYINSPFNELAPQIEQEQSVTQQIKTGQSVSFNAIDPLSGRKSAFAFEPVQTGNSTTPWSIGISIPLSTINAESNKSLAFTLVIGFLGLVLLSFFISRISRSISSPLKKTTHALQQLSRGNIDETEKLAFEKNNEIGDLAKAVNQLFDGLNSAARFANQIGEGNLKANYTLLSNNDDLGNSLLRMQKSLSQAQIEEEKKKAIDEKRNWVTHGLAEFAEIIRQDNENMEKFSLNVVKNLIKYIDASQAAIYIKQEDPDTINLNDVYELKAAMAYGKPALIDKTIEKGQELVGRAADENKIIYLEDIPEDYVLISPGMKNEARPRNLIISPMCINDVIFGVLEIISYKKAEPHHLEFIEKLSENIASVISSVKTNIRTASLLEQSRVQADELAQHEEEMRQNLEEMQATQEEASKRQNSLNSYIKTIKGSVMVAELDLNGRIIDISPAMTLAYGSSLENMRGKFYDAFIIQDEPSRAEFVAFWETMLRTGHGKRMQVLNQRNRFTWLLESYLLVEKEGIPSKVFLIVVDKTKEKELNDMLKAELASRKKK